MSLINLVIDSQGTALDFQSQCDLAPGELVALNNFMSYLGGLAGGNVAAASLNFNVGSVQAAATFTVAAGGSANGQIGTLLNQNLTAVTSGAVPASGQFNISATAATQAASMVTAINSATGLIGKVIATRNGAAITVTAIVPGLAGNGLQISAGNLANVTAGAFAGGTAGTVYALNLSN